MKTKLDTRPARTDLSSRECAKLLGATIGGLLQMAQPGAVKAAVEWWAENFGTAYPFVALQEPESQAELESRTKKDS